ncbi:MAG: hypothetical protein ACOY94_06740 [Bacillota bacterium]
MSVDRPLPPTTPLWTSLVQYYRSCLSREQDWGVRVPADRNAYVLLHQIEEHLITRRAVTTILADPQQTQPVLGYLNRRGRGIGGSFIYGYPLVRHAEGLIPLCFTEVRLEPGTAPQTVVLTRGNAELLVNRPFLLEVAGLTDAEVSDLLRALRSPKSKGPVETFEQYLLEIEVLPDGVLFGADAAPGGHGGPGRELQLMEQLRKERLPDTIRHFIGEQGIGLTRPAADTVTILPADPSQEAALQRRHSPFLVVTGPAGSGKSRTAINLIAGAATAGQRVLYLSRDEAAAEEAFATLTTDATFPGVLRIGGRDLRAASLAYARQVISLAREFGVPAERSAHLTAESRRLGEELTRLDAEAEELLRLDALTAELTVLTRQVEESLAHHPHRSSMEALAGRLTPESAVQFRPEQLVELRQLVARAVTWETEAGSLGARLREMKRVGQIKSGLRQMGLPEFCQPEGDLEALVAHLVRLEQAFPLLLARARSLHAQAERARFRPLDEIRAELGERWQAKVAIDRKRLRNAWLAAADKLRPRCDELEAIIDQEEAALGAAPGQRGATRRSRFPELVAAFPVVISQTLAVAGSIPNEPELFDLLIVDDASQIDIPSFLPLLYRAKRLCVLGDEHGLRHRSTLGEEEDSRLLDRVEGRNLAAFAYTEVSVLDRAMQVVGPDQVIRLTRQHRKPALRFEEAPQGQTIYPVTDALSQAQNPLEAREVLRLLTQQIAVGNTDLAVLTPFRGQALLLRTLLNRLSEMERDGARAAALRQVAVATPRELSFVRYRSVLLSLVAARGATPETLTWLEKRRTQLDQLLARATEGAILVGHRETLTSSAPLAALLAEAEQGGPPGGEATVSRPGLQPERLGLLQAERPLLREALTLAGAVAELLSEPERELYARLSELAKGRQGLLAPRLPLARVLEPAALADLEPAEREAAAGSHPLLTLVHAPTLRPVAVIELEASGAPVEAICRKVRLPLVRVQPGQWEVLPSLISLLR